MFKSGEYTLVPDSDDIVLPDGTYLHVQDGADEIADELEDSIYGRKNAITAKDVFEWHDGQGNRYYDVNDGNGTIITEREAEDLANDNGEEETVWTEEDVREYIADQEREEGK